MVRNIWFHCLIASMTGTKSSNAEINVHKVGDLFFFFYILTSPCYLQVSIKF